MKGSRTPLCVVLTVILAASSPCIAAAQEEGEAVSPTRLEGFDPGVSVGRLLDPGSGNTAAAAPFAGLATRITVDPLFGTAAAKIPIEVPPGRRGLTPDVALHYSSGRDGGPIGVGWDLGFGSIERNTAHGVPLDRGLAPPTYTDEAGFVLRKQGAATELDRCLDGTSPCVRWGPGVAETWIDAVFDRGANMWRVRDKNGLTYTYGTRAQGRSGLDVTHERGTFAWYLSEIRDPNGNTIEFEYARDRGHVYPTAVSYGANRNAGFNAHIFHVGLAYDRVRPDAVTTYRGGFPDTLAWRLATIGVWVDGRSTATAPTRRYHFSYEQDPETGKSQLVEVALSLADGTPPPPAARFDYSRAARALADPLPLTGLGDRWVAIGGVAGLNYAALADVDGDGRRDYLVAEDNVLHLYRNTSGSIRGRLSFESAMDGTPWSTVTGDPTWGNKVVSSDQARLVDIDGDGLTDFVRAPSSCCPDPERADCGPQWSACAWEVYRNVDGNLQTQPTAWPGVPRTMRDLLGRGAFYPDARLLAAELLDADGDGLPDILDCVDAPVAAGMHECRLHRNHGAGFAPATRWPVPVAADPEPTSLSSVRDPLRAFDPDGVVGVPSVSARLWKTVVDLNGDGLPDLARSSLSTGWEVAFNNGSGFGPFAAWTAPAVSLGEEAALDGESATTIALRDLNGDGLPDLVDARQSVGSPWQPWTVFLNTGEGFRPAVPWAGTEGRAITLVRRAGEFAFVVSDVVDVNGDGIGDLVERVEGGGAYARLGIGGPANLLVLQENGLGASCTVSYVGAHDAMRPRASDRVGGESRVPFPVWVVEEVSTRSGFAGSGPDLRTRWGFEGGHFDPGARRFRGFRQSMEVRLLENGARDGRQTLRVFAPPPYRPSLLSSDRPKEWPFREWTDGIVPSRPFKLVSVQVNASPAGTRLRRTSIDWTEAETADGRVLLQASMRTESAFGSGGGTAKEVVRALRYDEFNNVIQETAVGDDVAPVTSVASYAASGCAGAGCPGISCPGLPTSVATLGASGTLLTWRSFDYDARCNLRRLWSNLSPQGSFARIAKLTVLYDTGTDPAAATGQPTAVVDLHGNRTTLRYDCRERATEEDTYALFPCSVTNALGHETLRTHDLRWGKPLRVIDANGAETRIEYDGLGRTRFVYRPLDAYPWREFRYLFGTDGDPPAPSLVETRFREPNSASGDRRAVAFFDGMGRALAKKERRYVEGTARTLVTEAVAFDDAGRVRTRFTPFEAAIAAVDVHEAPSPATAGTVFTYDALDRIVTTRNADGSVRRASYGTAGKTIRYDENFNECANPGGLPATCPGMQTIETRDAFGRLLTVEQRRGETPSLHTANTYDDFGRVTQTVQTDVLTGRSAVTRFTYDHWGRRVGMDEADAGTWHYEYDLAGNLVFQDDPKDGQRIEFCYDALNRMTRKVYVSAADGWSAPAHAVRCSSTAPSPRFVDYAYDLATERGCTQNAVGRLCAVNEHREDGGADTWFTYDARGRVTEEAVERTVVVSATEHLGSYRFRYEYDTADRRVAVNYPTESASSTERLAYTFDEFGQPRAVVSSIQTYAAGLVYDRFGRLLRWNDGSGLRHRRTYAEATANFRLTRLEVVDAVGNVLQSFDYPASAYDVTGNLRRVVDTVQPAGTAASNTWTYEYDSLARLTQAQQGNGASVPYVFDGLGNMAVGNGQGFAHDDGEHPHRVSAVVGRGATPAYDQNGALTFVPATARSSERNFTYDPDGRLDLATTETGRTVRSVYDYRGARIARVVDEGLPGERVTLFYGRWFEVTGSTLTRNFFLGDRLIAVSSIAAPPALLMTAARDEEQMVVLARTLDEVPSGPFGTYPVVRLGARSAVLVGALVTLFAFALVCVPGRTRLGFVGRVRRGWVALPLVPIVLSLTPLPLARPAQAGGGGGGGCFSCVRRQPTYFVATDHQGSTTMLTCYAQGSGCADRAVFRHYRYEPYGSVRAFDRDRQPVAVADGPTDLLYTGGRWDAAAELYHLNARFYDPALARFLSLDPLREYASPYAYGRWNPVKFTDPTGLFSALTAALEFQMGAAACGGAAGCNATLSGLQAARHYTAATGGYAQQGPFAAGAAAHLALPSGVTARALDGLGGALDAAAQAAGGAEAANVAAEAAAADPSAFSTAPFTAAALIPRSPGELVTLPLTLFGFLLFYAGSGMQPPVLLTYEGVTAFYFGGNPSGYLTLGHAMWGLSSTYSDLVATGLPGAAAAGYLQHEFGHVSQYAALGATFLALYLAQFPLALALLQTPFQFNVLENFFLGGAPTTYDLNPGSAGRG